MGHSDSECAAHLEPLFLCLAQGHLEPPTFLFLSFQPSRATMRRATAPKQSWVTSRSADVAVSSPHPSCSLGDGGDVSPVSNRWAQPCITSAEPPTPGDATHTHTHTHHCTSWLPKKKKNTSSWQKIIPWTRTSWEHVYFYIMYNMLCVCSAASGLKLNIITEKAEQAH